MLELNRIYNQDCIEGMKLIDDKSIDLIICDLPYGTTACSWDVVIPFDQLWAQYKRIIKFNHPIVLFATQPFTATLIVSNIDMFRYTWVWEKSRPGGFVNANLKPLKYHEDICVFTDYPIANGAKYAPVYYPTKQKQKGSHIVRRSPSKTLHSRGAEYFRESVKDGYISEFTGYPSSILKFSNPNDKLLHPTQKPIKLIEYLIKIYSLENQIVLDNCMGSGTTAMACLNTKRNYIGFETNVDYFNASLKRIKDNMVGSLVGWI